MSERKTEKTPPARLRIPVDSGQIAPSRSDGASVSSHAHVERMHFSVESIGRKAERVLAVQFIGDSSERRRQIPGGRQFEIPPAGRRGDFHESLVRMIRAGWTSTAVEPAAKPSRP